MAAEATRARAALAGRGWGQALVLAALVACGGGQDAPESPSPPSVATRSATVTVGDASTGKLQTLVSTIVDPTWEHWLFERWPNAAPLLAAMAQRHMLIVLDENTVEQVIPLVGSDPRSPDAWDFSRIDAVVQPMLRMGDHSPIFMVAAAPPHMYDGRHKIADLSGFAQYAADLVRYYNGPGIPLADGTVLRSPSRHPIMYWSILNETNLSGAEYRRLYDRVVPAMQAVDPTLRFVAAEIAWTDVQRVDDFLTPFLREVTAQVDMLGIHFFPAGRQDSDQRVFGYVPESAANVRHLYERLATNPSLADVPVWITSYNTTSWGGVDARPTSAFYAAWAPYFFSRVAQAGARSLHHWEFAANVQFGEIDQDTGDPFIGYWVDTWLGRYFSAPPERDVLALVDQSHPGDIETLAVRAADGRVIVMVVNHAVASASDNNGRGVAYTVDVDIGSLGAFTSARELIIDAEVDVHAGPTERTVTVAPRIPITLNGYGVGFLDLRR